MCLAFVSISVLTLVNLALTLDVNSQGKLTGLRLALSISLASYALGGSYTKTFALRGVSNRLLSTIRFYMLVLPFVGMTWLSVCRNDLLEWPTLR